MADLTLYRFDSGAFSDDDGRMLTDLPQVLGELHDYWQRCCQGRRFPSRADIDPVDIPRLLEHLLLIDVLRDPLDLRYRLVGGHIVDHGGRLIQGRTARGLLQNGHGRGLQQEALDAGRVVAEARIPVCVDLSFRTSDSDVSQRMQGILLPLGPSEGELDMLLVGVLFLGARSRAAALD